MPGIDRADVSGDFETHLTVRRPPGMAVSDLIALGDRLRLKFTDIVLDRGETPNQPMFSGQGRGSISSQLAAAKGWTQALTEQGMEVVRVKVEAAPWSGGIPRSEAEAADEPPGRYFEHHVKLLLSSKETFDIAALVGAHQAHVSRNARRIRDDGLTERFVTQRCHGVGQETARERLGALRETLATACLQVCEVEEEYVVFDSNFEIDLGWIEAST
jgi:hypothetical protein